MIILASKSPRRIELMQQLGWQFSVQLAGETDEQYPPELQREEIPLFLSRLKANSFMKAVTINNDTIVITADTIVWITTSSAGGVGEGRALGKPNCRKEAIEMLEMLSNKKHYVYTAVCLTTNSGQHVFFDETKVFFKYLSSEEINFYVDRYQPYDKAGAYGIQEWIGYVGIEKIEGSFYNVMGLPVQKLYNELSNIIEFPEINKRFF